MGTETSFLSESVDEETNKERGEEAAPGARSPSPDREARPQGGSRSAPGARAGPGRGSARQARCWCNCPQKGGRCGAKQGWGSCPFSPPDPVPAQPTRGGGGGGNEPGTNLASLMHGPRRPRAGAAASSAPRCAPGPTWRRFGSSRAGAVTPGPRSAAPVSDSGDKGSWSGGQKLARDLAAGSFVSQLGRGNRCLCNKQSAPADLPWHPPAPARRAEPSRAEGGSCALETDGSRAPSLLRPETAACSNKRPISPSLSSCLPASATSPFLLLSHPAAGHGLEHNAHRVRSTKSGPSPHAAREIQRDLKPPGPDTGVALKCEDRRRSQGARRSTEMVAQEMGHRTKGLGDQCKLDFPARLRALSGEDDTYLAFNVIGCFVNNKTTGKPTRLSI